MATSSVMNSVFSPAQSAVRELRMDDVATTIPVNPVMTRTSGYYGYNQVRASPSIDA